jgi:hypothetical protein
MQISFFEAAEVMPAIGTVVHQQHQEYQQNPKQVPEIHGLPTHQEN